MKTFLANLKHVSRDTEIGGGTFTPAECHVAAVLIRDMTETLAQMTFTVETVAHLRGMEQELLPVADKAHAILARVQS